MIKKTLLLTINWATKSPRITKAEATTRQPRKSWTPKTKTTPQRRNQSLSLIRSRRKSWTSSSSVPFVQATSVMLIQSTSVSAPSVRRAFTSTSTLIPNGRHVRSAIRCLAASHSGASLLIHRFRKLLISFTLSSSRKTARRSELYTRHFKTQTHCQKTPAWSTTDSTLIKMLSRLRSRTSMKCVTAHAHETARKSINKKGVWAPTQSPNTIDEFRSRCCLCLL